MFKKSNKKAEKTLALKKGSWKKDFKNNYELYLLSLPAIALFIIFCYFPMVGVQIAFRNYKPSTGFFNSEWVGLENFQRFFNGNYSVLVIKNTLIISLYQIIFSFPCPIILALMINEVRNSKFKKTVQLVTYAPHFISTVVVVGMITIFTGVDSGVINNIIELFGGESRNFMSEASSFRTIYILSDIWQTIGWNSIIYFAALSGIDPGLHEAAKIDGANKFQRIWHVDIPGITPTMIILLIMRLGHVMTVGYEKVYLMQNALNLSVSELISTYVYKMGLINADYSYSAAVGLFNSLINLILLITVNNISRRVSETSLW